MFKFSTIAQLVTVVVGVTTFISIIVGIGASWGYQRFSNKKNASSIAALQREMMRKAECGYLHSGCKNLLESKIDNVNAMVTSLSADSRGICKKMDTILVLITKMESNRFKRKDDKAEDDM